jgi:hypothetical protein
MLDFPKNPPPSPFVKGGSQSLNLMAVGVRGDLKPLTCQEIPLNPPLSKGEVNRLT